MTNVCGKWLKYLRNGKKYITNHIDMQEMAKLCGNGLGIWQTA